MTGRPKDVFVYLQCMNCEDIFRMVRSSYEEILKQYLEFGGGGVVCPQCSHFEPIVDYIRSTRAKWKKSNEVKPDKND